MPCMDAPHLLLIVFAWWQLVSETVAVGPSVIVCTQPKSYVFLGKPSETHRRCLEEVQAISCATLFLPVTRPEAVQAMSSTLFPILKLTGTNVISQYWCLVGRTMAG